MPAWPSRQSRADTLDVPLVNDAVDASGSEADRPPLDQPGGAGRPLEATASVWHQITFGWLDSMIAEGYRRECLLQRSAAAAAGGGAGPGQPGQPEAAPAALTERDLLELRPDDTPEELRRRIDEKWAVERAGHVGSAAATRQDAANLENGMNGGAGGAEAAAPASSYRRALRLAFARTYIAAGLFKFVYDTLQMGGPYILRRFLSYLNQCEKLEQSGSETCEVNEGLILVAAICATSLIQTAFLHQYFHRCFRTGMRMNAATICVIYAKALRLAGPGKGPDAAQQGQDGEGPKQRTSGEIVNLMSVDAQRLQDTMTYLHTLWSGPYQIIIALIFLSQVVHWATFAGLAVMLLQIPIMTVVTRRIRVAQRALMKIKDERVKVTNEVFSSMKLLKMYGWEDSFGKRIDDIRETELVRLRTYQMLNIISTALYATTPILTGVATFGVYTALYGTLTAATAFTALSLFNVLRFPLIMFPNMISSSVEANIAISRIEEFLASKEIQGRRGPPPPADLALQAAASASSSTDAAPVARLHEVRLAWPDGTPLLAGLSLSIPAPLPRARAHMTVVLGAVGTGKSGLLQALIGDLSPVGGSIAIVGSIAYTAQVAWIRNATVKDNVLFNKPFNQERYAAVIEQCALLPDLDALPNGEMTEIGEKGVNLSGGQKQRVSLARAVYAAPDLLLLDDPLSAVDSEVAKTLLKMLRGDLVKSSSIILCTHHLGAIHHADQVVMLERLDGDAEAGAGAGGASPPAPRALETRVAFCGPAEEFTQRYSEMLAGQGRLARQLSRQESEEQPEKSAKAEEGTKKNDAGRLVEKEEERIGSVSGDVYMTYIQAGGGMWLVVAVIGGVAIGQALQTSADSWVSFWSDHSHHVDGKMYVSSLEGLLGYIVFSLSAFIGVMVTSAMFRLTALKAARWFHKELLDKMLRLPMSFYDRTPLGRVLNRFSKDIYTVDEQLQQVLYMYLQTMARVTATIVVIAVATPWFLLIVLPLLWMYRYTQNYYIPTSRQLKRIESTLRSPIFSHFAETLDGVASIRAFGQQTQFMTESAGRLRRNMRAYYASVSSNRWLAVRLETLGTAIVTSAGLLATIARDSISPGIAGLSISYALSVTQALNWVVRMTSDRETNIVSVERLREYIRKEPEPPRTLPEDPPESAWPTRGAIEFKGIELRYRPDLPLVLQGLSLSVAAQEKLGICGRTGAGKSSVLNVLLRIVTVEGGCTLIDGVDISGLGLYRLRRSITIIPQESVLFSGTLRFNLDPLEQWSGNDAKLWQALSRSHLETHARTLGASPSSSSAGTSPSGVRSESVAPLDTNVAEAGGNFSVGQRQQLCLARALLRTNRILLLDEATSAVDHETDALIQETIRAEFDSYTVLCIAHRISTIMGFDRVCVLESGKVAELGAPKELMEQEGSRFQRLAKLDASH